MTPVCLLEEPDSSINSLTWSLQDEEDSNNDKDNNYRKRMGDFSEMTSGQGKKVKTGRTAADIIAEEKGL